MSADPDRRARFEREAKAIAALSHPNILAIHDIGQSEGEPAEAAGSRSFLYAVTELLEGETLRDRLTAQGALPVRKGIDVAVQVARGLAAAHDRGVVHRDLKPENLFLLQDGQVKILDFGLARQTAPAGGSSGATETAAVMTEPGTVMGTVGYMAPEQVRGTAIDARTDLFAFGAVLYEILAGRRAFARETAAETLTAILREDPPELSSVRAELSPALERIVRHCLEKNPAERFQTARDIAFALEAFSGTAISSSAIVALPTPRRSWVSAAVVAVLVLAGVGAGYSLKAWFAPSTDVSIGFETRTWDSQWITNARFGPDGQTIVYSAATAGNVPDLFVARPGTSSTQPLGPRHTHLLSVSNTGELAVLTDVTFLGHRLFKGTLARMTMDGGARPLLEQVREADWAPDGMTLAIIHDLGSKDRLEYPAGKTLYEAEAGAYLSDPRVSPDGTRVAFFEHPARYDDRGWLKIVDRAGTVTTHSDEFWGAEGIAWSPDGQSILMSAAGPSASGYYPRIVKLDGKRAQRAAFPSIVPAETMDVGRDGRMLVNQIDNRLSIRALLPGETVEREFPWLDLPLAVDMSTDGRWLLFTDQGQSAGLNYAVALRKTDGTPAVRLGEGVAMALSPDTKWAIGFVPSPAPGRYVVYPTGPGQQLPLDLGPVIPEGRVDWIGNDHIFFCGREPGREQRCYRKAVSGGPATPLTPEGVSRGWTSPDGRTTLVHMGEREWQLFDATRGQNQGRPVPGNHADDDVLGWSRDNRSVFVRASSAVPAQIERVDLTTGARTHQREIMPPDRTGVMFVAVGRMVNDGQAYSYAYWRQATKAIVVSGVPMH